MGILARRKLNIPWLHTQGTPSVVHVDLAEASPSGQTDLRLCGDHISVDTSANAIPALQEKCPCRFVFSVHLEEIEDGLCFHNLRTGMLARHEMNIPFPYMLHTPCELDDSALEAAAYRQIDLRLC